MVFRLTCTTAEFSAWIIHEVVLGWRIKAPSRLWQVLGVQAANLVSLLTRPLSPACSLAEGGLDTVVT